MVRFSPAAIFLFGCLTALAAAQEAAGPIEVPRDEVQNLIVRKVAPLYPPLARQARIQGTVLLNIIISKTGDVTRMQLVSGHPMLAPAAIEAVKQWKYRPYEKDGEPVDVSTMVQVNFKMPDTPPPPSGVAGDIPGGIPPEQTAAALVHPCEISDSSRPQRVRVSSGVMQGLVIEKKAPAYPEQARNEHVEGVVALALEIGKDGAVCDIALVSGHPRLAPAALDAVRQWKYRPYLLNGMPVEVQTQALVNFTLRP